MASQSALQLNELGGPLVKVTRPIPTPKAGEVVVKVTSAGINPHDQKLKDLGLWGVKPPLILADDVAGEVIALGPDVTTLKEGDHVFTQTKIMEHTDTAGLQQYALVTADLSAKVPSSLTDDQAATISVNALAPFIALFHETGLGFPPPGSKEAEGFNFAEKNLVIVGAGSNCGKLGVQFAAMAGFGKIITIASTSSDEELRDFGATRLIDRHLTNEEIKRRVQEITGGDDILYVYDPVTKEHELSVSLLSGTEKGVVAALVASAKAMEEGVVREEKRGHEVKYLFGASHAYPEFYKEFFWKSIPQWIETGAIKPLGFNVIKGGLNAAGVNEVFDKHRDGHNPGKWHVHPNE